jgi:hypothetical protein
LLFFNWLNETAPDRRYFTEKFITPFGQLPTWESRACRHHAALHGHPADMKKAPTMRRFSG